MAEGFFPADAGFWQGFWYVAQGMPSRSDGMPCDVVVGGVFAFVLNPKLSSYEITKLWSGDFRWISAL